MEYLHPKSEYWKYTEIAACEMYDRYPKYFLKPGPSKLSLDEKYIVYSFDEYARPLWGLENGPLFVRRMLFMWNAIRQSGWQVGYTSWRDLGVKDDNIFIISPEYEPLVGRFRVWSEVLVNCTASLKVVSDASKTMPKSTNYSTNPYLNKLIWQIMQKKPGDVTLLEDDEYKFIGKHWNDLDALLKFFAVAPLRQESLRIS